MKHNPISTTIIDLDTDKQGWLSLVLIGAIWSDKVFHEKEKDFFVFYLNEVYENEEDKHHFIELLEREKMEVSQLPFPNLSQDFSNIESVEILDLVLQVLTIDEVIPKLEQDFFLYIGKYLRFINHTLLKDLLCLQIESFDKKDFSSFEEDIKMLKKQIAKSRANIPVIQKSVHL